MEILGGEKALPGTNTISYILSNTIRPEPVKICELNGNLEDSTMCVKFMDGVFDKQSRQDFVKQNNLYTLSYDLAKSTELELNVWTYTDSDVYIEVGGKIDNAWYIRVRDTSPEPNPTFFDAFHDELYYISQRDDDATYPWCASWEWDDNYNDTSFPAGEHTIGSDRYQTTIIENLDPTFMSPILRIVDEMQPECSVFTSQSVSASNFTEEISGLENSASVIGYTDFETQTKPTRFDYTGPSFRHVLMACNIRDEKVDKNLHSVQVLAIDYRDYLIMKEWLRLGNPDEKNLQSRNSLIAWFNKNSKSGTPVACGLPYQIYDFIGSGTVFADAYSGEENL